jgi:WD40 repeat protein
MSYEEGKIEIASLDLATKTLNVVQELEGHGSDVYDVKELSDGKLVSCSNNGEIIFWSLNPALNTYEKFKFLKTHPKEYSSLLEDTERNKLICAPCFDSYATCIIDLQTYEIIATFNDIAGNGGSELYFVNDNIVIDNSAADEVGLFFIDMDKNEIVKHDEKFNDNKSSCFFIYTNFPTTIRIANIVITPTIINIIIKVLEVELFLICSTIIESLKIFPKFDNTRYFRFS